VEIIILKKDLDMTPPPKARAVLATLQRKEAQLRIEQKPSKGQLYWTRGNQGKPGKPQDSNNSGSSDGAPKKKKWCKYWQDTGHEIAECRKRIAADERRKQQPNKPSADKPSGDKNRVWMTRHTPAEPAVSPM